MGAAVTAPPPRRTAEPMAIEGDAEAVAEGMRPKVSVTQSTPPASSVATEAELKEIQTLNQTMQQITMAIGQTFISSYRMLKDFDGEQTKLNDLSKKLEEIYGKVNININDGTITPIEEEEQPKD